MNLPELCIRRPVMTTLLMAAFVIFGLIAYRALPVSELPSVDFPTIQVTANLPGDDRADIVNALLALGYNEKEALGAVKTLPEGVGVSDGIRQALKGLSKA